MRVDFAEDRKMSLNTMVGIGLVILLHVVLVYALVSGLATSVVDVIKKPLEIKIIQAPPAPPPPPPAMTPPPPPPLTTPPPPYIPPPLIQVAQPPPPPVFAVTTAVKPPPAPARPAPATPAAARPASTDVGVVCPNVGSIAGQLADSFQDIADSDGIDSATVVVQFTIGPGGEISGAHIVASTFPGVNELALQGIAQLHCNSQGETVTVRAPFSFRTN